MGAEHVEITWIADLTKTATTAAQPYPLLPRPASPSMFIAGTRACCGCEDLPHDATDNASTFIEQARQLVRQWTSISKLYVEERDVTNLAERIASFASEAATAALEQERNRVIDILNSKRIVAANPAVHRGRIAENDLIDEVIAAIGDDKEQR